MGEILHSIANWLNIKNKKIDPNYSLFSSYNDDNLDIFKNKFNELRDGEEDDLPIDIREKSESLNRQPFYQFRG
ncbi:hypothetical protein [Providencia huaxiensis]|uniref:hypothetical protein n=1 Tax=Providencia huaxiensis TaxID=2027290 RepID=UPI0034DCCB3A